MIELIDESKWIDCSDSPHTGNDMVTDTGSIIKNMANDVWERQDLDALEIWYSDNFITYVGSTANTTDLTAFRHGLAVIFTAFSNTKLQILDQIINGEMVASRLIFRGTHSGEFMGLGPTYKSIAVAGCRFDRVKNGKIIEHWSMLDIFSILNQMQKT